MLILIILILYLLGGLIAGLKIGYSRDANGCYVIKNLLLRLIITILIVIIWFPVFVILVLVK